MEGEKKQNILLNSRIAVGVGLLILLLLSFALIAQGLVDTHNYRAEIIKIVEDRTGHKIEIKGDVTVALLPVPTLYIAGMELRAPVPETPNAKVIPTPAARIELITLRVSLLSMLKDKPKIFAVTFESPTLEITRGEDSLVHWDWIRPELFKGMTLADGDENAVSVEVRNGRVLYHDVNADNLIAVQNITALGRNGRALSLNGSFRLYGHEVNFTMQKEAGEGTVTPFNFKVTSGPTDFFEVKGEADISKDLPSIKGTLGLDVQDASIWIKPKELEKEKLIERVARQMNRTHDDRLTIPLKINSSWSQQGLSVDMENFNMQGLNSDGSGKVVLRWDEWMPKFTADMAFRTLDLDQWRRYLSSVFGNTNKDYYTKAYRIDDDNVPSPIPKNIEITAHVVADKVTLGPRSWGNAKLSATMADGAITVNHFGIELPGNSHLSLFGVITPSATNDLRFEGSMETKGDSLRSTLTVFDESANGLPETGFGSFSARSNIFVSSEQLRLSDADVKLADLHLNGGLVAYFDSNVRLEADVRLKNINFDYFRDVWREKQRKEKNTDFFLKFDKSVDFNWLKKLQATIDFRVGVKGFTFLDHAGDSASFRIYARSGDLGIYDINFVYPTDLVKGHFKLNVNGEQPLLDVAMSVGFLDTNYFTFIDPSDTAPAKAEPKGALREMLAEKFASLEQTAWKDGNMELRIAPQAETVQGQITIHDEPVIPPREATGLDDLVKSKPKNLSADNTKRWSEELIDMSWMNGISGIIDLNVGKFMHKGLRFDNLKLQTNFSNNLMTFSQLSFSYWGGQCSILGSVYGGKVPGFVATIALTEMHLDDMMRDLIGRDNLYGNISLNAALNTSGVNMLSWVSQAEGKMVLVGRGVAVRGINMPSVVTAVTQSRTPSDVVNNVNRQLIDGSTTFSVDGNINVKNGMLRTPGITLRTGQITGDLVGEVKLINWTMDMATMFQFPELSSETVPVMHIQLAGPLKSGEMRTDTSSLEAYVAKRIISR